MAGFIGSPPTNFLNAGLVGGAAGRQLGIRPEHVRVAAAGRLEAHVAYAEALGAETLVHLRAADGTPITVRQEAALPIPHEGDTAMLDWSDGDALYFDADGKRL